MQDAPTNHKRFVEVVREFSTRGASLHIGECPKCQACNALLWLNHSTENQAEIYLCACFSQEEQRELVSVTVVEIGSKKAVRGATLRLEHYQGGHFTFLCDVCDEHYTIGWFNSNRALLKPCRCVLSDGNVRALGDYISGLATRSNHHS